MGPSFFFVVSLSINSNTELSLLAVIPALSSFFVVYFFVLLIGRDFSVYFVNFFYRIGKKRQVRLVDISYFGITKSNTNVEQPESKYPERLGLQHNYLVELKMSREKYSSK